MIKSYFVFILLFGTEFFLANSSQVFANELIKVTIQSVEMRVIKEDSKSVQLEFSLDLTITNTSKSGVILYGKEFEEINLTFFKIEENKTEIVLYNLATRGSNFVSPEVLTLQKNLSIAKPPSTLTKILKDGESYSFRKKTGRTFFKTQMKSDSNVAWQELLKLSPVFMTITLEMFPHYLNTKPNANAYFAFGKHLQKKWKKYGYFWFDDIVSEPILLDLNSAVVKTHLKP